MADPSGTGNQNPDPQTPPAAPDGGTPTPNPQDAKLSQEAAKWRTQYRDEQKKVTALTEP